MGRKAYPAEFRRRALALVAAGKTVAEVARLLEVSDHAGLTTNALGMAIEQRDAIRGTVIHSDHGGPSESLREAYSWIEELRRSGIAD